VNRGPLTAMGPVAKRAVVGRVLGITARIIEFKVELEQTLPAWPFGQILPPSNHC
jgi:hypothetical protein